MVQEQRDGWPGAVRRVVVKVGSRALVGDRLRLDEGSISGLVEQIVGVRAGGRQVVLVSSGAIAAGLGELGWTQRPRDLPGLQAAAAAGQARLIGLYRDAFARHGAVVAQVLLTHSDLRARERHLNARNTLSRLLGAGVVPIVNENDTVAVDEIRVGDNDLLSALVANLISADLLVLLTTADGLLSRPPGEGGKLIARVESITAEIRAMAGGAGSSVGTGGMRSKLQAAEMVSRCGIPLVIANARLPGVLPRILAGETVGTLFDPGSARMAGRKRWIAFFHRPRGQITVDRGAAGALRFRGSSLLAIGVKSVAGDFERGDPVSILDEEGLEIARGLVNYPAPQLRLICGRRSDQIATILGHCEYEEVIHRDNLVLA